ncbi:MAG: hypothetical protein HY865_22025 [Chloroflexi bacterium]|nr:hypothetical protein [Chloroflexota bacterium]
MSSILSGTPIVYFECRQCKCVLQNPTPDVLDEWKKEHQGHTVTETRKYPLFDLGYNDLKKAGELAQIANELGAVIADIRFMPHTRNPEFSLKHLQEVLGDKYIHVGELGNANYKGTGGIQLANTEAGMRILHGLLANSAVIIICACWKRSECHRVYVAKEYEKRYNVDSTPITRTSARDLLSSVEEKNNPQLALW